MKIHIREIDHVVIRVADLESITRFYCDVLGCSVEKEQRDLGLIQLRAGRSLIDLLKVGAKIDRPDSGTPGEGRNMDHLCLRVEGFDGEALRRICRSVACGSASWACVTARMALDRRCICSTPRAIWSN